MAIPALLGLLAVLAFAPALRAEFVSWDDGLNLVYNPRFRGFGRAQLAWMFTTFHAGHYMPLTWMSWAADHALWGMDPRGFHATNLALHAIATMLVYALALRLLERATETASAWTRAGAAVAALFFALHPLRAEVVCWATARIELLSSVFLFASVLLWLEKPAEGRRRTLLAALSLAAFALSLVSKAMGITLPIVLFVLDVGLLRRLGSGSDPRARMREVVLDKIPYVLLAVPAAVLAAIAKAEGSQELLGLGEFSLARRVAQTAYGLVFYVLKTVAPVGLSPLYELKPDFDPWAPRYVLSLAFVLAASALTFAARRRAPEWLAAWTCYVVLLAPVVGLVQSGVQSVADRYSYVACVPWAILVGAGVLRWARSSTAPRLAISTTCALVLGALAVLSFRQSRVWLDSESLWGRVVAVDPASFIGHEKLGIALHQSRRFDEAIAHYERCLALRPGELNEDVRHNLALSELATGRLDEARAELERIVAAKPAHLGAVRALKVMYEQSAEPERAFELLVRAVDSDPSFAEGYLELADLYLDAGDFEQAREAGEHAVRADPSSAAAHNKLGLALMYLERFADAEAKLRRASELAPENSSYVTNLGVALDKQGRAKEARDAWRRALEIAPDDAQARRRLEGAVQ